MKPGALLREVIPLLGGAGIPYMVVGSFAASFHGEPRTTHDLDLVIDPTAEQLERFLGSVDMERFYVDPAFRRRSMFDLIEMTTGWKVDLIVCKARPFSVEEMRRRQTVTMCDAEVAASTAEDTVISKLEWSKQGGSERQLDDVAAILRVRHDLDLEYVERWVNELELAEQWRRARDRR